MMHHTPSDHGDTPCVCHTLIHHTLIQPHTSYTHTPIPLALAALHALIGPTDTKFGGAERSRDETVIFRWSSEPCHPLLLTPSGASPPSASCGSLCTNLVTFTRCSRPSMLLIHHSGSQNGPGLPPNTCGGCCEDRYLRLNAPR